MQKTIAELVSEAVKKAPIQCIFLTQCHICFFRKYGIVALNSEK